MNYSRDTKNPMQQYVELALSSYTINNAGAGYSILRYTAQGLIETVENCSNDFLEWYPLNQSYTILRLALAGKLRYKQQTNL